MAQYSQLSIYNKAFAVLRELHIRAPGFEKQHRYFLGGRLLQYAVDIITIIIQANGERDGAKRVARIEQLVLEAEMLITHLRIANELKQLGGQKQYLLLSQMVVDLSKQAEGWKKYKPRND